MFIVCSCKRIKHFKWYSLWHVTLRKLYSKHVSTLYPFDVLSLTLIHICIFFSFPQQESTLFFTSHRMVWSFLRPMFSVFLWLKPLMSFARSSLKLIIGCFCFPWLARGADYRKNALHNKRLNKNQTMYLYHFLEE